MIGVVVISLMRALPALAEMSARVIMQKQDGLHSSKYEYSLERMILVDKSGRQEERRVRNYTKDVEDDESRSLIVFLDPADIKGTALLTWQHKAQEDDQWLYLPARGKMQRIAKGGKKNYFMGTDFTYEDLEPEALDDYTYKLVREEEEDGTPCYVIEAVPADSEKQQNSSYSKRLLWVSKDHFNTLKIEFYDRRDKLVKTQINRDWENVSGTIWRAKKALMDNHKTQHKTLIGIVERRINEAIDEQTFTERFILKGQHTQ
jgi:hypothetical protein